MWRKLVFCSEITLGANAHGEAQGLGPLAIPVSMDLAHGTATAMGHGSGTAMHRTVQGLPEDSGVRNSARVAMPWTDNYYSDH